MLAANKSVDVTRRELAKGPDLQRLLLQLFRQEARVIYGHSALVESADSADC